ncbi:PD-(D/E)XK nuclease-like domain-containing protein [Rhodococcus sp. NPDC127528]|uniref:PD-(D/E)XK nuclease-like domain-containing protein n=1 Tax=unclassified Rhodococcus (in: high G+C Gram-positive bacteria) TaxID=192944 RepID=UPI003638BA16
MSDIVDVEGAYDGIPDHVYHSDRGSLSSSGARKLLPPSCPAIFRHERDHPPTPSNAFDLGHAAHSLVLGEGSELRMIPAEILSANGAATTKDAKAFVEQARADGAVPLKPDEYQQVHDMAAAVRANPYAASLLRTGVPERSLFWRDPVTGVWLRARPDWTTTGADGRPILVDYKTSTSANPDDFRSSAAKYGYHQQAPYYLDGMAALGVHDCGFVFIVQDKNPPYLVSVVELTADAMLLGRDLNRAAIDIYAECTAADQWPGYGDQIHLIDLPKWAYYSAEETLRVR